MVTDDDHFHERALSDDALHQIELCFKRDLYGPWEMGRLIATTKTQRKVLQQMFDFFQAGVLRALVARNPDLEDLINRWKWVVEMDKPQ